MYEKLLRRIEELEARQDKLDAKYHHDAQTLEPLYTIKEVCDLLRCSKRTIYNIMGRKGWRARYLRYSSIQRKMRVFWESEVKLLLEARSQGKSDWENPARLELARKSCRVEKAEGG